MSDWTDEIQGYIERNHADLAEAFIEKNFQQFEEFASEIFFKSSLHERMGIYED